MPRNLGERGQAAGLVAHELLDRRPQVVHELGLLPVIGPLRSDGVLVGPRAAQAGRGLGVCAGVAQPAEVLDQGIEGVGGLDHGTRRLVPTRPLHVAERPALDEGLVLGARARAHGAQLQPFEGESAQLRGRPLVPALPDLEPVRHRGGVQVGGELAHLGQVEVVAAGSAEEHEGYVFACPRARGESRPEGHHAGHEAARRQRQAGSHAGPAGEPGHVHAAIVDGETAMRVVPEPMDDVGDGDPVSRRVRAGDGPAVALRGGLEPLDGHTAARAWIEGVQDGRGPGGGVARGQIERVALLRVIGEQDALGEDARRDAVGGAGRRHQECRSGDDDEAVQPREGQNAEW